LATSGIDFQPLSGTATFQPGATSQVLAATVIGDDTQEPGNESFFIMLSNASGNAQLSAGNAEIVIFDNDPNKDLLFSYGSATQRVDLRGGIGNDTVIGGNGDDILWGDPATGAVQQGIDVITGNGGADRITGGLGPDRFVYNQPSDSTLTSMDRIRDFRPGTDQIVLPALPGALFNAGVIAGVNTPAAAMAAAYADVNADPGVTQPLSANQAVLFAYSQTISGVSQNHWFLAMSDGNSATSDLMIDVTGISGGQSTLASSALSSPVLPVSSYFAT
jgi:Ca2+-binding RTX toxin-like protein